MSSGFSSFFTRKKTQVKFLIPKVINATILSYYYECFALTLAFRKTSYLFCTHYQLGVGECFK